MTIESNASYEAYLDDSACIIVVSRATKTRAKRVTMD